MKIGFIGLSQMGSAMESNLLKANHEVAVQNRSPGKADALVAAGARRATSPRDAAEAEVVMMTMLADDGAPESVVYGKDGVLGGSALHASHSTISIASANRLATNHAAHSGFLPPHRSSAGSQPPNPPMISTVARHCSRPSASRT